MARHIFILSVIQVKLVMLAYLTCTHLQKIQKLHTGRVDGSADIKKMAEAILERCPNASPVMELWKSLFSKKKGSKIKHCHPQIIDIFVTFSLTPLSCCLCPGQIGRGERHAESCHQNNRQLPCVWSPAQTHEETGHESQHQAAPLQAERCGQQNG